MLLNSINLQWGQENNQELTGFIKSQARHIATCPMAGKNL